MKADLLINDYVVPLNDFTQNYIGNVLKGIASALGHESENVTVSIDGAELFITTEKGDISIIKDFTKLLIESTIKGILSPLKGVVWSKMITIACRESGGQSGANIAN